MELDQIVTDHSIENLEQTFQAKHVIEMPFFSILVKETSIPWLLFIPKAPMENTSAMLMVYSHMHKIAAGLKALGRGHYNIAKIGNKNPWLHLHLVFRNENDEAWPDAIWCHEPLSSNERQAPFLAKQVIQILKEDDSTL